MSLKVKGDELLPRAWKKGKQLGAMPFCGQQLLDLVLFFKHTRVHLAGDGVAALLGDAGG